MELREKQKIINKINARIKRTRNWLKNNDDALRYFEDQLVDLFHTEGISNTGKYLSKKGLTDANDLAFKTLEEKLPTRDQLIENASKYLLAHYEDDDNEFAIPPHVDQMDPKEILAAAGKIVKIYDSYADALGDFYNMRDSDIDMITDEKVKQEIVGLLLEIDMSIRHPGEWELPVSKVEENKKKIANVARKLGAV